MFIYLQLKEKHNKLVLAAIEQAQGERGYPNSGHLNHHHGI